MNKRTSIVWSIPKEDLLKMVESSSSIKELVSKVGLNNKSGSNDLTVKKCLEYHNIDWKSLALKGATISRHRKQPSVSDEELFQADSKYGRNVVRNRVLKKGLIPYKCAICGQESIWNGKEMPLVLDHINGLRNDHRLENLRFVCPNCNQQLETTGGNKNSPRRKELKEELAKSLNKIVDTRDGRIKTPCPICGKPKDKNADICLECHLAKVHKEKEGKIPSKNDLISNILKYPLVKIGKLYGVSDNTIRKWLQYYELPYKRNDINKFRKDNGV